MVDSIEKINEAREKIQVLQEQIKVFQATKTKQLKLEDLWLNHKPNPYPTIQKERKINVDSLEQKKREDEVPGLSVLLSQAQIPSEDVEMELERQEKKNEELEKTAKHLLHLRKEAGELKLADHDLLFSDSSLEDKKEIILVPCFNKECKNLIGEEEVKCGVCKQEKIGACVEITRDTPLPDVFRQMGNLFGARGLPRQESKFDTLPPQDIQSREGSEWVINHLPLKQEEKTKLIYDLVKEEKKDLPEEFYKRLQEIDAKHRLEVKMIMLENIEKEKKYQLAEESANRAQQEKVDLLKKAKERILKEREEIRKEKKDRRGLGKPRLKRHASTTVQRPTRK